MVEILHRDSSPGNLNPEVCLMNWLISLVFVIADVHEGCDGGDGDKKFTSAALSKSTVACINSCSATKKWGLLCQLLLLATSGH